MDRLTSLKSQRMDYIHLMKSPRTLALVDQVVVSGSNFLTVLALGRLLPEESFGTFSLAMMACLFLANLHRAVLTQPMNVLGASETKQQLSKRLAGVLKFHMLAAPMAAVVLATVAAFFFPSAAVLVASIAYLSSYGLQEVIRRYWYTRGEIAKALANDLISYAGQLLLIAVLWLTNHITVWAAFAAMAATSFLAFAFGLYQLENLPREEATSPQQLMSQHWPMARWLALTVLAVWGAGQVYPFLMAPLGPIAIASFAACRNLLNVTGLIVQTVGNYLPARGAALLREHGTIAFRRHVLETCLKALLAGLALFALLQFVAVPLLNMLYGGRYDHAAPLLRILAFGTVCSLIGAILGAYALALEDSRSSFIANLCATGVTFTVGLWLIQRHGLTGAAIATTLSLFTAMAIQALLVLLRLRRLPVQ